MSASVSPRRTLISILNWNGLDDTLACLDRLMPELPAGTHVVVLDNGSTADPSAMLAQRFPTVELKREAVNLGFTGGHNAVMRLALARDFDTVLLLNNDCLIDRPALTAMDALMRSDDRIAAVSPLIYTDEAERRPQMVGGWIDWRSHRSVHPSLPDHPAPADLPTHVLGTALLLRVSALRTIGLLDDRYFAYYEDNDFSVRIAAAGYVARYCGDAVALHRHRRIGEVSALSLFLSSRNAWMFWREHTPAACRAGLARSLIAQQLQTLAGLQADGASRDKQRAVVDGSWAGWHGRSGPPPLQRAAPAPLHWFAAVAPYLLSQLIADPVAAVGSKLKRNGAGRKNPSTP